MSNVQLDRRAEQIRVGDRATVKPHADPKRWKSGHVAYIGPVKGLPEGVWIGVRLDKPEGKNDGSYNGVRYFDCGPQHGSFVRVKAIEINAHAKEEAKLGPAEPSATAPGVLERLEARHRARMAEREQRTQEREEQLDPAESTARFWTKFNASTKGVRAELDAVIGAAQGKDEGAAGTGAGNSENTSAGANPAVAAAMVLKLSARLDALVASTKGMQEQIASASSFLPGFDVYVSLQTAEALASDIEAARQVVAPRRKFRFSARQRVRVRSRGTGDGVGTPAVPSCTAPGARSLGRSGTRGVTDDTAAAAAAAAAQQKAKEALSSYKEAFTFAEERQKTLVLRAGELPEGSGRDGKLSDLKQCVVVLLDVTSALRCDRLDGCHVLCGPVAGSVHLQHCTNCTFMLASRQVRIHDSYDCDFYLHVASNPIFEDCKELRFAPYSLTYDGQAAQMQASGLARMENMWQRVDDFKWHRAQHSPNWCELPEADRVRELSQWTDLATLKTEAPDDHGAAEHAANAPQEPAELPTAPQSGADAAVAALAASAAAQATDAAADDDEAEGESSSDDDEI